MKGRAFSPRRAYIVPDTPPPPSTLGAETEAARRLDLAKPLSVL